MPLLRVCQQAYLFMPRDRGGIGRTGQKRKKSKSPGSSHTSPQVMGATPDAVAAARAAAGAAKQAPSSSPSAMDEENLIKRVRFERNPPRITGIRRVRPVSDPWTWTGRWDFAIDHPAWSRNKDGTPIEVDLQRKRGRLALTAHRWGLRVAEHVAGGFKTEWPSNRSRDFECDWMKKRTHRRWCPSGAGPTWAEVRTAGAVRCVTVVSSTLATSVVYGSVRVKCLLEVL